MTNALLADAPRAADDAAALVAQVRRLTIASLIGTIGFEERIDIAAEMGDLLERLDAFRLRVRG